jgi:hypothetical protein
MTSKTEKEDLKEISSEDELKPTEECRFQPDFPGYIFEQRKQLTTHKTNFINEKCACSSPPLSCRAMINFFEYQVSVQCSIVADRRDASPGVDRSASDTQC